MRRSTHQPPVPLPLPAGELGEYARAASTSLSDTSWSTFINAMRVPSLQPNLHHLPHHASAFLHRIAHNGVLAVSHTPPSSLDALDAAVMRGSHSSATREYRSYLVSEMCDMVHQGYWCMLPYHSVRSLPGLHISPAGVVPQRDRRPRPIIDYSWSQVNQTTAPLAPFAAMQFGLTLQRVLQQIAYANPAFGPVLALKCDLSYGFYRVPLASSAIPSLGVILPYSTGEPLIAFPLALPMGWTNSPPFFSAFTETATDIANQRLASQCPINHPHRLEHITPDTPPVCAPHHSSTIHHPYNPSQPVRPLAQIDIYVDDFIGLAQRPTASAVRRTLLHTIDQIFRPPTASDNSAYRDPVSLSKLAKGDLHWGTSARILGWDIDTAAGTIRLPPPPIGETVFTPS